MAEQNLEQPTAQQEDVKQGGNQTQRDWDDDDFEGIEYLTWPKVGKEASLMVNRVFETKDTKITSNKTGKVIDLALSGVDYSVYIEDNSKIFSEKVRHMNIGAWEVLGKLKKILRERKAAGKDLYGWKLTIKHLKEGRATGEKQENYELIEED